MCSTLRDEDPMRCCRNFGPGLWLCPSILAEVSTDFLDLHQVLDFECVSQWKSIINEEKLLRYRYKIILIAEYTQVRIFVSDQSPQSGKSIDIWTAT